MIRRSLWAAFAIAVLIAVPAAGQSAPVELVVRGAAGRVFSHANAVEVETQIDFGPVRQREASSMQSRIDVRVTSINPDGTLTLEITERERRLTAGGQTTRPPGLITVLRVRPNGQIVEIREGEHASKTLLGIPLPPRSVVTGDTWDLEETMEIEGMKLALRERSILLGTTAAAEGTVARFTSTITGEVLDVEPPELPDGFTMRLVSSRITGSAQYEWNVQRGQPLRYGGQLTFDIRLEVETPDDETMPGNVGIRVTFTADPVATPSGHGTSRDSVRALRPGTPRASPIR